MGERCPVHVCAAGKAILAFLSEDQREAIHSNVELTRFTENTITIREQFSKALAEVRRTGVATCHREDFLQYAAILVPVFGAGPAEVAALNLLNLVEWQGIDELLSFKEHLLAAAAVVSGRLGAEPLEVKAR